MDKTIQNKLKQLLNQVMVMTIAVSNNNIPWSTPVYFVFHGHGFYFFSNENSRHIRYSENMKKVSASVFKDSNKMDAIHGLQMSGTLGQISDTKETLVIVKKYVTKFNFLIKIFGRKILTDQNFFLKTFKSRLYCFYPDVVFLSDNSGTTTKRLKISLTRVFNENI